jgi:GTPase Era involved in 16S rRNA processing/predicted  nucleic acid-binding Zn-ribbon protein
MSLRAEFPRGEAHTVPSPVGMALAHEVHATLDALAGLDRHRDALGGETSDSMAAVVEEGRRRLARGELFVCVVGEKKVGKSTFLNAVLGTRLLGTGVREYTGTVTCLRYGSHPEYRATLADGTTATFEAVFPARYAELSQAVSVARQELERSEELVTSLPRRIEATREKIAVLEQKVISLGGELADHQADLAALRKILAARDAEADAAAGELAAVEKQVPIHFRSVGEWWEPWIWGTRLAARRWERPEWAAHYERVKALGDKRAGIRELGRQIATAMERCADAERRLGGEKDSLKARQEELTAASRRLEQLPTEIEQRRARIPVIEAELAAHTSARLARFHEEVRQLTDMAQRGADVVQLDVWYPSPWLSDGLVVMDTPGVNTDTEANRQRAWEIIRREADGCIVLSDLQQVLSVSTREFVRQVREVVPHLVLVLTKQDRALDAAELGVGSAAEQIGEAKRIAVKRFAQEVGRETEEILCFVVAAERALVGDDPQAVARFAADMGRLRQVLVNERTAIVGAGCGQAIRRLQHQVAAAQEQAEQTYRETIGKLEAQQILAPAEFCRQQLLAATAPLPAQIGGTVDEAWKSLKTALVKTSGEVQDAILACTSWKSLAKVVDEQETATRTVLDNLLGRFQATVERSVTDSVARMEGPLLGELRQRYGIVQAIAGSGEVHVRLKPLGALPPLVGSLGSGLTQARRRLRERTKNLSSGGQVGNQVIRNGGSVVAGILVAVAAGGVRTLLGPKLDAVRQECASLEKSGCAEAISHAKSQLSEEKRKLIEQICRHLADSLQAEVGRYQKWIGQVLEGERRRLNEQRDRLNHLVESRQALDRHQMRLAQLMEQVSHESLGLCREPIEGSTA